MDLADVISAITDLSLLPVIALSVVIGLAVSVVKKFRRA